MPQGKLHRSLREAESHPASWWSRLHLEQHVLDFVRHRVDLLVRIVTPAEGVGRRPFGHRPVSQQGGQGRTPDTVLLTEYGGDVKQDLTVAHTWGSKEGTWGRLECPGSCGCGVS